MAQDDILTGEVLDEVTLTLDELAKACAVEPKWVEERVEAGMLSYTALCYTIEESVSWRFASADLLRARRLASIERDFDANQELAALVADLLEEVVSLRRKLEAAGISTKS